MILMVSLCFIVFDLLFSFCLAGWVRRTLTIIIIILCFFFFQAEDGIRDIGVTGVQTCALPIFLVAKLGSAQNKEDFIANQPSYPDCNDWIIEEGHIKQQALQAFQTVTQGFDGQDRKSVV